MSTASYVLSGPVNFFSNSATSQIRFINSGITSMYWDFVGTTSAFYVQNASGTFAGFDTRVNLFNDIIMNGNAITSAGLLNGVSLNSHASRHNPGGADPLYTGTILPNSIGTTNFGGTATELAPVDHVHAHGIQSTSTHHSLATLTSPGFIGITHSTYFITATNGAVPNTLVLRDSNSDSAFGKVNLYSFGMTSIAFSTVNFMTIDPSGQTGNPTQIVLPRVLGLTNTAFCITGLTNTLGVSNSTILTGLTLINNFSDDPTTQGYDTMFKNASLNLQAIHNTQTLGENTENFFRLLNSGNTAGVSTTPKWGEYYMPLKDTDIFDDFVGYSFPYSMNYFSFATGTGATLGRGMYGGPAAYRQGMTGHFPGVINLTTSGVSAISAIYSGMNDLDLGASAGQGISLEIGSDSMFETALMITGLSSGGLGGISGTDQIALRAGFIDQVDTIGNNSAWFEYDETVSPYWKANVKYVDWAGSNGITTFSTYGNTIPIVDSKFTRLTINFEAIQIFNFLVNGTTLYGSAGTFSPPICPAGNGLGPVIWTQKKTGTTFRGVSVDYAYLDCHTPIRRSTNYS